MEKTILKKQVTFARIDAIFMMKMLVDMIFDDNDEFFKYMKHFGYKQNLQALFSYLRYKGLV